MIRICKYFWGECNYKYWYDSSSKARDAVPQRGLGAGHTPQSFLRYSRCLQARRNRSQCVEFRFRRFPVQGPPSEALLLCRPLLPLQSPHRRVASLIGNPAAKKRLVCSRLGFVFKIMGFKT